MNTKKTKISVSKENTFCGKIFRLFLRLGVAPICRLVWLKKIEGKEHLPKKGAYILACNHQSYLDFILLISALPNVFMRFLAAEKFYHKKVSKFVMEHTGQIKVERESKEGKREVIEIGSALLEQGNVLAIFPQGTRSRTGEIEKTFTGVAKFATRAGVPIIPVGIRGAFQTWAPKSKPVYKKQVSIFIGKPIDVEKDTNKTVTSENLRELTDEVMQRVAKLANKNYAKEG